MRGASSARPSRSPSPGRACRPSPEVAMPTPTRRGTILLVCLAIVTTLMVLAYAFVRAMRMQDVSNDSENREMLARAAAVTGTNHAIEQILRDYATEPLTRLDSPSRAAFV